MLALCLMLLVTYYALNYAGIIGLGLHWTHVCMMLFPKQGNFTPELETWHTNISQGSTHSLKCIHDRGPHHHL